jgi:hypothetical protein
MTRLGKLLALTTTSLLLLAASAQAAAVVVGSPLTKTFKSTLVGQESSTFANRTLSSGNAISPVSGVIVRWSIVGASGGPFTLDVLRPGAPGLATALAAGEPVTPASTALESFPASLPIQAGDSIGLTVLGKTSRVGQATGTSADIWEPALALGESRTAELSGNQEIAFNAEVQLAPTVTSFTPLIGFTTGGTRVTITGTELEGASAVSFGGVAATFTVDSETQITATAPSGAGSVAISVTTPAGTATALQPFTYATPPLTPPPTRTCTVPRLRGKTLKSAKKQIRAADCRVGKLTKKEGATAKYGEVVKQAPRPGTTVAADTKVQVTLAP